MRALPENPNQGVRYNQSKLKSIYLAGGCFWGTQAYLKRIYGVAQAECGYANGETAFPTYEQVCRENTGHAETVHVRYDPDRIALGELLQAFFKSIDPTSINRQGADAGVQYRTGIYYTDEGDAGEIEGALSALAAQYESPLAIECTRLRNYYPAEEYHQDYLDKNPGGYCHINLSKLLAMQA